MIDAEALVGRLEMKATYTFRESDRASERACSIITVKLLIAALRPLDFDSELTAGTRATSRIEIIPMTTRSSINVNAERARCLARVKESDLCRVTCDEMGGRRLKRVELRFTRE